MPPEAPCWEKLRQRVTLVNNDQCLLDLDKRLQVLEARTDTAGAQPMADRAAAVVRADQAESDEASAEEAAVNRVADVVPIPVSQRLPELHELDRQGRCWAYRSTTHEPLGRAWVLGTPVSLQLTRPWCSFTHWLPHWSLPIVEDESETEAA